MEELISKLVKIPLGTKLGALAGVVVLVTAANYFLFPGIAEIEEKTVRLERTRAEREAEFTKKQQVANNLDQYKRQLEVVEQRLKEALTEMPEDIRIDDLLTQLSELAKKAGLSMRTLKPMAEARDGEFYFKIPIKMSVEGGYHEIAVFLDSVSKLKRIVNVNNIEFGSPKVLADKVVLSARYMATTFRFAGDSAARVEGAQ
ncbi:MAG: type 4a pilus biogenesis protein PilO [Deltaproteobacteria bacterium]|nr:type 4a pilus biogenesis protein PilO [Deltaproteobacteria bacterium]